MMRRFAIAAVVFGVGACTAFSASGPLPADAGPELDGSSQPVVDTGVAPPDAGTEADGDARTDAPPPRCDHFLCEDFTNPGLPWKSLYEGSGGSFELDNSLFASPPRALRATSVGVDGVTRRACLTYPLPAAQRVRVSASVLVNLENPPDSEADVIGLEVGTGGGRYYLGLIARPNRTFLVETLNEGRGTNYFAVGVIAPTFTTVSMDIDFTAGRLDARLNNDPPTAVAIQQTTSSGIELRAGIAWAQNARGAYVVNIDDLIIDQ